MTENHENEADAGQRPHTPGQDPEGSGEPREGGLTGAARRQGGAAAGAAAARGEGANQGANQGDAPLGGDEATEEQLDADNAVEEDTLKSLDPDDSPA